MKLRIRVVNICVAALLISGASQAGAKDFPVRWKVDVIDQDLLGGNLQNGKVIYQGRVWYNYAPLYLKTFTAESYAGLVAKIQAAVTAQLGSQKGACNSCDCADGNYLGEGDAYYTTGPVTPGAYTRSILNSGVYPEFSPSSNYGQCLSGGFIYSDGPNGFPSDIDGLRYLPGYACNSIAMNFEYDVHLCRVGLDGSKTPDGVQHISETGTYLWMHNHACPVYPLGPNGSLASIMKRTSPYPNVQYVCEANAALPNVPPENLSLIVGLNTGYDGNTRTFTESKKQVTKGDNVTVHIPLGGYFYVAVDNGTNSKTITVDETDATVEQVGVAALFPNTPILEFSGDYPAGDKYLLAVHLGSVKVNINDNQGQLLTLNVSVDMPSSLGLANVTYDDVFDEAANRTGVMGMLLKGIADRESGGPNGLNPMAYRYEPFWDLKKFQGLNHRLEDRPYRDYRVRTTTGLADGVYLNEVDTSIRDIYYIKVCDKKSGDKNIETCSGIIRQIEPSDQLVSALNIFTYNDTTFGKLPPNRDSQNWSGSATFSFLWKLRRDPSMLDFTAQTYDSASYGLMQMLYTTAIRPVKWSGLKQGHTCFADASNCSPTGLFDTMDNISNGGGSVFLAADYLRRNFNKLYGPSPTPASFEMLNGMMSNAVEKYNEKREKYAKDVFSRSHQYVPVQAEGVLQ